jgi:hypothetical protein
MVGIPDILVNIGANIGPLSESLKKAGVAVAAFGATVGAFAIQSAAAAVEMQDLANAAGASLREFQRAAAGARSLGIENEKLSDIFRDVNDKIGDFTATGGGELKDFFEKIAPQVGVTADQFKNLSGPQSLQLFVSTLEKANVSSKEMTFYLEAIASDASLLTPLLKNNGAEFARLGDQVERYGLASEDTAASGREFRAAMAQLGSAVAAVGVALVDSGMIDAMAAFIKHVADFIGLTAAPFVADLAFAMFGVSRAADDVVRAMGDEIRQTTELNKALNGGITMSVEAARQKLLEARSRLKNVQAMIAEQKTIALSGESFASLTKQIKDSQSAEAVLRGGREGSSRLLSSGYEAQSQLTADLLNKRQALLDTDTRLAEQQLVAADSVKILTEALAAQRDGMVTTGGGTGITPTDPATGGEDPEIGGTFSTTNANTNANTNATKTPEQIAEDMAMRLEALRAGWQTESEATAEWYAQSQQTLAEALAAEFLTTADHKAALQRLEQEHASRVAAIEERKNQQTQRSQDAAYASVKGGLMALFGETKAVRVAMAIADTFAGANRALSEHPAPYSYAIAAGIIATGFANVKSIMSARPGGGGASAGGGAGAAAGAAAAAKEPDRTQTFSFNIQNDSMGFGESFARQMVEQLNNAQRNGGTIRGVIA